MIRKANIWDALDIVSLWSAMQDEIAIPGRTGDQEQKERFYVSLITKLYRKDFHVLVAEEDKKIVGFILGKVQYYEYGTSDLVGLCDHVYVLPAYRNEGIFQKLMKELMAWGKKQNIKSCEFITVYDHKVIDIWEKKGFRPTQVIYSKEV